MIRKIFAFFGYTKIPLAAVQLSLANEHQLELIQSVIAPVHPRLGAQIQRYVDGQKTLTALLRSCRKVQQ